MTPENGRQRYRVIENPDNIPALIQAMTELVDPDLRHACERATRGLDEKLSMARHADRLEA